MNAETTARRVLAWAEEFACSARSETGDTAAPVPSGALDGAATLANPTAPTIGVLARLTWCAAARMGTGSPPLGDPTPIGLGGILLAAAIGGRAEPVPARMCAEAVSPPRLTTKPAGWSEAIARHAVVYPYVLADGRDAVEEHDGDEHDDDERDDDDPALVETLLECSPLTALLHRPSQARLASGAVAAEVEAAFALVSRPHGTSVLERSLCRWSPDAAVLNWRAQLLQRLTTAHPDLVVDTYVAARLRHGANWDERIASASRRLSAIGAPDELSLATIRYWLALSTISSRRGDLFSARRALRACRRALRLANTHRVTIAGARS